MSCPFCRFGAWLLGKQNSIHEPPPPQSPPPPQNAAVERPPPCSSPQRHEPPPPVQTIPKIITSGSESLDALRDRTPSRSYHALLCQDMLPPIWETRHETLYAAVATATNGMLCALAEPDPAIAAARAVRAIALAASTSHCYSACLAATTAAEFEALLCAQDHRCANSDSDHYPHARYQNVVDAAFEAVRAHEATLDLDGYLGWPWNTYSNKATNTDT